MSSQKQKIAVAVVHGIGKQDSDFAIPFETLLRQHYGKALGIDSSHTQDDLVIKSVHWAPALEREENLLRL